MADVGGFAAGLTALTAKRGAQSVKALLRGTRARSRRAPRKASAKRGGAISRGGGGAGGGG